MLDTAVAQHLLDTHRIAYIITDETLNIIQVGGNDHFLDVTVGDIDLSLTEIVPELIGYEAQLAAMLQGTLATLQLDLINRETSEGKTEYIGLKIYPHESSEHEVVGLLLILEDMTLVGTTQQRLTQQHNELLLTHQQLNKANLQLAAVNAELRGLDELKSRFVSIAAHELRTPIASLIGYIDFLVDGDAEPLTDTQRSSLGVVRRSARRLLTITSDLLDVTHIEVGRLELLLESINLPALIQAVIHEFQPQIDEKALAVSYSPVRRPSVTSPVSTSVSDFPELTTIPPVLCDEKRTIQILSNLLSNAIKYTPQHGAITISLFTTVDPPNHFGSPHQTSGDQSTATDTNDPHNDGYQHNAYQHNAYQHNADQHDRSQSGEQSGGMVVVQIVDTGIGIPTADLRQLGKAFFRAGNVYKARTHGTGLGLHITRSLLELQGGTLHIESTEGQGTTVTTTFPIDDGLLQQQ